MTCRLLTFLFLFLSVFTFMSCASRGVPGGGPVDRTPPEIISTEPIPDSTQITELNEIVIIFSERMDEPSVESAIFISPPLKFETEWSGGDEVTLLLQDTLRHDATYVVTIGSGASDSRKNRMSASYQFAFSTGATIQKGQIKGLVYGITERDPFYVFGYFLQNQTSAEIDPTTYPADFLTQPGANGAFSMGYLKPGKYRVFIVEDQNRNLILDSDYERVGIPTRDVMLDSTQTVFDQLYFKITRVDTSAPKLTGARAINDGKVLVRLSEPVNLINPELVSIIDTLNGNLLNIRSVISNKEERNQYFIFTNKQMPGSGYRLQIEQLCDTTGNCQDSVQLADFSAATESDTVKFKILKISPRDSAKNVAIERPANFALSNAVDTVSFTAAFKIYTEAGDTLKAIWQWDNLETGYLQTKEGFMPGESYQLILQSDKVYSMWGDTLGDSTISRFFSMRSADEFGSFSGLVDMPANIVETTHLFITPLGSKLPRNF